MCKLYFLLNRKSFYFEIFFSLAYVSWIKQLLRRFRVKLQRVISSKFFSHFVPIFHIKLNFFYSLGLFFNKFIAFFFYISKSVLFFLLILILFISYFCKASCFLFISSFLILLYLLKLKILFYTILVIPLLIIIL